MNPDGSCPAFCVGSADKLQRIGVIGQHNIRIGQITAAAYLHIDLNLASHRGGGVGKGYLSACRKCCQHLCRHHHCHHACHYQNGSPVSHSSYHHLFPLSDYHVFFLSGLHLHNSDIASARCVAAARHTAVTRRSRSAAASRPYAA